MMWVKVLFVCLVAYIIGLLGFCIGSTSTHTRDYEAACLLHDCIRTMMDDEIIGSEVEEHYYEFFQDLDMGVYNTKKLTDIDQLKEYYWCY